MERRTIRQLREPTGRVHRRVLRRDGTEPKTAASSSRSSHYICEWQLLWWVPAVANEVSQATFRPSSHLIESQSRRLSGRTALYAHSFAGDWNETFHRRWNMERKERDAPRTCSERTTKDSHRLHNVWWNGTRQNSACKWQNRVLSLENEHSPVIFKIWPIPLAIRTRLSILFKCCIHRVNILRVRKRKCDLAQAAVVLYVTECSWLK
jgi:hypothetical protein